jgi:hypothetical protein
MGFQISNLRDVNKEPRGCHHAEYEEKTSITLVRWHNNAQVTMASNLSIDVSGQLSTSRRWSKEHKTKVQVPQPELVRGYNKFMGGVDPFDQQRGKYRVKFRSN